MVGQMTSQVVAGVSRQGAASEQLCKLLKRVCDMLTALHNNIFYGGTETTMFFGNHEGAPTYTPLCGVEERVRKMNEW